MKTKMNLQEQAVEILRIAEETGVQTNFFFVTTFKRYQVQLSNLSELEKAIKEIITKYDEKGNIRRIKGPSAKKKVILPGMYKPTKKKEHKVLGHKGADMRKKKKKS